MEKVTPTGSDQQPGALPSSPAGRLGAWLSTVEQAAQAAAMIALAVLCALISLAVISRALWTSVVPDQVQWVQILMVVIVLAPLAMTSATRQHIEVEVFVARAGKRLQAVFSVLGHLAALVFLAVLAYAVARLFGSALSSGEYFDGTVFKIPNWLGRGIFLFCIGLAILRTVVLLITDASMVLYGRTGRHLKR